MDPGAHVALILYDITDLQSFEDVRDWIHELRAVSEETVIFVVGAKYDLSKAGKRRVDRRYARWNWQHGLGSKPGRVYSIWLNRQPNNPGLTPCNIPVEQLRGGIACVPLSSRLRQLGHRRNTRSFHLRHCRRILSDPYGLEPTVSCRS